MSSLILADDLSGALEAGAAFRACGWKVTLPLGEAERTEASTGELRVVTTESRNLSPHDAAAAVRRALGAAGGRLALKKIDSTLRGPVVAELRAAIEAMAPPLVILCPANPAAGRTVRGGVLCVRGVPLADTEFREDPIWPATDSEIAAWLAKQGFPAAGLIRREDLREKGRASDRLRGTGAAAGARVWISDAENEEDVAALVREAREAEKETLFVGSGALAAALARESPPPGGPQPPRDYPRPDSLVVLCGSRHPATKLQLERLSAATGARILVFEPGVSDAKAALAAVQAALVAHGVAAVKFTVSEAVSREAASRLMAGVVEFAQALAARVSPSAYYLTGGETAGGVCRSLRGLSLEVLRELEPGVVVSVLTRKSANPVFIITKPGGFGSAEAITRAIGR